MTATAAKLTKIQTEALRKLHAGQRPFCRSAQTHNALSHAGLIDFERGRGWVITNAGLDAIGVETDQGEIADWKTVIASVCPCGHGHRFADYCTDEACDCSGYRPSCIDLVFSPSARVWGLRKATEVTVLPLDRPRRTSRQARVAAIRSVAR
jgi:hypothetical protein